jgi:hypothetical protein
MLRREFIAGLGGAAVVRPHGAWAQERMKAGETPWNQGRSNGRPCPFPEGGPEDEGKTPR